MMYLEFERVEEEIVEIEEKKRVEGVQVEKKRVEKECELRRSVSREGVRVEKRE